MKKIIFGFAAVLLVSAASAQIQKGTVLAGASSNFGFNNSSPKQGSSSSVLNLDLKGGYFVVDNVVVGLLLDYSHTSSNGASFSSTSFGIFGRYYYQGKIFGGLGLTSVSTSSGSGYTLIPIEIGYAAFITSNVAVEPSLNITTGNNQSIVGLNVGFTLYLNRK